LNVGIFFNARRNQGGLYQWAASLVHSLATHERRHRYTLFLATGEPPPVAVPPSWKTVHLPGPAVAVRMAIEAALFEAARLGWHRPLPLLPTYREMEAARPEVMLYVKPSLQVFLWPFPAVFPIHDLQHVFQPEFPEVSARGEERRRDFLYRHAVPAAGAILADSEVGREDILRVYRPAADKVHALPHLAPPYLEDAITQAALARVRARYSVPEQFLFYPAAFWRHKNHRNLLLALDVLVRKRGVRLPLLLAGARSREYPRLVRLADELGLSSVRFLGYVPDEDVYPLYRLAQALVMPTFFGPSNLPNIEAWTVGCPLITSDIRGLREQVGDAGLLADPRDPEAIAEAIWRVFSEPELRQELIERGKRQVARWGPADFAQRLASILERAP
jgi:glycosyltransferase involved in cell wall biosynthesis